MIKIENRVPAFIREIHRNIKRKTHSYYWWKHNKSAEEQEKINNVLVISIDDLAVILGDAFESKFSGFDKEALKLAMTQSTMPEGYWNTDSGN